MNQLRKISFIKIFGVFWCIVLLLTFLSKTVYNVKLPLVTIIFPERGNLTNTVKGNAVASHLNSKKLYTKKDGRVKEVLVRTGDKIEKGQKLMVLETEGGKVKGESILAEDNGIVISVSIEEGMYVSSMSNTILMEIAGISNEWKVEIPVSEEQLELFDRNSSVELTITETSETLSGKIEAINQYAKENYEGYMVTIIMTKDNDDLAGKRVDVTIKKESETYDAILPNYALRKDATGYFCLVLQEKNSVLGIRNVAVRRSVDLLDSDTSNVAVRGLLQEDPVIAIGSTPIEEGSLVRYEESSGES